MSRRVLTGRVACLVLGVLIGVSFAALATQTPLRATATDRGENFAVCTGTVDNTTEGIFTLDFLTGDLRGAVIHPVTKGFTAVISRNILKDLKIESGKQPKFLIVTCQSDLRSLNGTQMGQSVVVVTELNSGVMGIYGYPYSPAMTNNRTGGPSILEFIPLQVTNIRNTAVRGQ